MADVTRIEWLNSNSVRKYPLVEDCATVADDGEELPDRSLLDMRVSAFGLRPCAAKVSSFWVSEDGSVARVSVSVDGTSVSAEAPASGGTCSSVSGDGLVSVYAAFGDFSGVRPGLHLFSDGPEVLPSRTVFLPGRTCVDAIVCGGVRGSGTISVADGVNTTLDIHGNALRLRVGNGIGLAAPCADDDQGLRGCGGALYYINGQRADDDGSFTIYGGDGVSVRSGTYRGVPAIIISSSKRVERDFPG